MQVQVSPAGDVAVATYQATVRTFTPGKPAEDESMLETDVWMHRAGGWKIVTIQYGAFVPAK